MVDLDLVDLEPSDGHYLGDELRPGLSVPGAGERYCALASPELYHLLTVEFAWTADQHQEWLTHLLRTELLSGHRNGGRRCVLHAARRSTTHQSPPRGPADKGTNTMQPTTITAVRTLGVNVIDQDDAIAFYVLEASR